MGKILLLIMNLAVLVHGILSLTGGMSYGAAALTSAIVYGGGLLLLPEVARHGKGILRVRLLLEEEGNTPD